MATHSSVLAWRIPELGEPGGLPSMGSHRVGHDLTAADAFADFMWPSDLFFFCKLLAFQPRRTEVGLKFSL